MAKGFKIKSCLFCFGVLWGGLSPVEVSGIEQKETTFIQVDSTRHPSPKKPFSNALTPNKKENKLKDSLSLQDSSHTDSSYIKSRSLGTLSDSLVKPNRDSIARLKRETLFDSLNLKRIACEEPAFSAPQCVRSLPFLVSQELGFPGVKSQVFSLKNFRPVAYRSSFGAGGGASLYGLGGVLRPRFFTVGEGRFDELVEVPHVPTQLDTPLVTITWEKGGLSLNSFQLTASRMMTENSYLAIDFSSHSADSLTYDYSPQVHQPYISLGRDSSEIVIGGVSAGIESLHLRPRLGVYLGERMLLEIYYDWIKNSSQLSSPVSDSISRDDQYQEATQKPLSALFSQNEIGAHLYHMGELGRTQLSVSHGNIKRVSRQTLLAEFDGGSQGSSNMGEEDYASIQDKTELKYQINHPILRPQLSIGMISEQLEGDLWANFKNKNLSNSKITSRKEGWRDEEYARLRLNPTWKNISFKAQTGVERQSFIVNDKKWLWNYLGLATVELPYELSLQAGFDFYQDQPDWLTRYSVNPILFQYANPELSHESIYHQEVNLFYRWKTLTASIGLNNNVINESVLPRTFPVDSLVSSGVADSLALQKVNYSSELRRILNLRLGVRLGHWKTFVEHARVIKSDVTDPFRLGNFVFENPFIPHQIYKGQLAWGNRFVSERLQIGVAWNWEWFGERKAWASALNGTSYPVDLESYLVLDFKTTMRIKSFLLTYSIKNFNHDRYYSEPGIHPPGINFRWSVHWILNG